MVLSRGLLFLVIAVQNNVIKASQPQHPIEFIDEVVAAG